MQSSRSATGLTPKQQARTTPLPSVLRRLLAEIRQKANLSQTRLAQLLGASLVSIDRGERGASVPSPAQAEQIVALHRTLLRSDLPLESALTTQLFSSRAARNRRP